MGQSWDCSQIENVEEKDAMDGLCERRRQMGRGEERRRRGSRGGVKAESSQWKGVQSVVMK